MDSDHVLLTGATGFLGRYLLRDLLAAGRPVAVLVRDARGRSAGERVGDLVAFCREWLGRELPRPVLVRGDLSLPDLGVGAADRAWLSRHCPTVLHAAACVTLQGTPRGEPWKTNVDGTERLLRFCRASGISDLHHVSTAFVCGRRTGVIQENDRVVPAGFHNQYEQSKFEGERRLRSAAGLRLTVYRPSVIVGDSVTGHTSTYHGIYRFLELGDRLAERDAGGRRVLPLRLPFAADELRNLVPVDWVARAIVRILLLPEWHGRTYHLTSPEPVPARLLKEVAEEVLGIEGVGWAAEGRPAPASELEQTFREHLQEYWPYLGDDPEFDRTNTSAALPDLPCPRIDRELLARLIRFGAADRWGRARRGKSRGSARLDCARYVEQFFPESVARSVLSRLPVDVTLGLDVRGAGGGRWTLRLRPGEPVEVRRGATSAAPIVYRLSPETFEAIVRGRETPQEAFFGRRIEVLGDVEKALKLAVLFGEFVRECPYPRSSVAEEADALDVCG
jgi:thioester reductase-like protein